MGLLQTLIDEIIPFPSPIGKLNLLPNNTVQYAVPVGYALLNLLFQMVDCIVVPVMFICILQANGLGYIRFAILVLLAFSWAFSWLQVLRFFIAPHDKYCSFKDRLLGETAIGYFMAAIFRWKISYSN